MPKTNRLPFIDALRGFAALYGLIFHVVRAPEFTLPLPLWIRPFVFNGSSGVALFFILSGFTLSYTLHNKIHERNSFRNFYIRRLFRIAPLYYVMLIFFIVLVSVINPSYINNLGIFLYSTFTFNLVPGYQEGLVPASWFYQIHDENLKEQKQPTNDLWKNLVILIYFLERPFDTDR